MREQVVVTVFDTITITKTITIRENESGDTLRVSTVTERDHVRDRSQLKVKSEKLKVETDTVYVERDSVAVRNTNCTNRRSATVSGANPTNGSKSSRGSIVQGLKWFFFILLAIIALILLIRLLPKR